ncbi:DUF799 domain-containing protein [uncultured Halopseudomonas sp.]|jgi:hypothetical protein|uniref:DUF799 domain-containing protein n=1 Tax=uncultured Halopseudomonas sp. TaxID=2901193 RepID=UPI0030ED92ED|tara:strand:- start:58217 stop:58879 length:663 start_codon:yes stop_codon:yes gene_type:complete
MRLSIKLGALVLLSALLTGCVTTTPYDYTAFRASNPRSILVLPPVNQTLDVSASYSFLTHVSMPLAESGYYVFPVAVVEETFRENGLNNPEEIHALPLERLSEVFGADSVMYIKITQYGTSFQLLASDTRVTADASLVDGRTGQLLWKGQATASSTEQSNNNSGGGGLVGMLVVALVEQVINTTTDRSYEIAGITSSRLLSSGAVNGVLPGPRARNQQLQ